MQQIVSISDARKNLSQLVAQVSGQDLTVVIVRDSLPEAVLVPYQRVWDEEKIQNVLWTQKWNELLNAGKKRGEKWTNKKLTEQQAYALVKQT